MTADQTYVEPSASFPTGLHIHPVRNTPRLECAIPSTSAVTFDNQLPASSSSSSTRSLINMYERDDTPLIVDFNESNIDHITSLERSLYTDFFCCGVQLSDFHALLEHFEEDHVVVLAPNGKRVYPPEGLRSVPLHPVSSASTTPASSRSSSVAPSSPQSPASPGPSSLASFSWPAIGRLPSRKCGLSVAPVYTPFTPSLPVDPAYPYQDTEIAMTNEPPFEYHMQTDFYPVPMVENVAGSPCASADEEMSDSTSPSSSILENPTSPIPTYVYGPDKSQPIAEIPKHVRFSGASAKGKAAVQNIKAILKAQNAARVASASSSKSSKSRRASSGSNSHSRGRREKAYRCPTPRCTKSYLNPNGLKYHIEKGTCKLDGEDDLSMNEDADGESEATAQYDDLPSIIRPPSPVPHSRLPPSVGTYSLNPHSHPSSINSVSATSCTPGTSFHNLPNELPSLGTSGPQPLPQSLPQEIARRPQVQQMQSHAVPIADNDASRPPSANRCDGIARGGYMTAMQLAQERRIPSSGQASASEDGVVKGTDETSRPQYVYPPMPASTPSSAHCGGDEASEVLSTPPICVPSQQPGATAAVTMPSLPVHPQPRQAPTQPFQYHYPVPTYPQGFTAHAHHAHRAYYAVDSASAQYTPHAPPIPGAGAGLVASARSQ